MLVKTNLLRKTNFTLYFFFHTETQTFNKKTTGKNKCCNYTVAIRIPDN